MLDLNGTTAVHIPASSYVNSFWIDLDGLKIGGSSTKMLYYSYKALYNRKNK